MAIWTALALGAAADEPPPVLRMRLQIGGEVSGPALDHGSEVVVIDNGGIPCAFAYRELTPASAYLAKRTLIAHERGGRDRLTARDHLLLGEFALELNRPQVARREFATALDLDPRLEPQAEAAQQAYRDRVAVWQEGEKRAALDRTPTAKPASVLPGLAQTTEQLQPGDRQRIIDVYKAFGRSVREAINPDLELIETDHFLIFTDWSRTRRGLLADWCERMYTALATQFGVDPAENVFLGKCPVFCFRSKARFLRFGRTYDNWQLTNANGYSRTAPNGHVHIVLFRRRATSDEFDRFAGTLVHEGTHAFVHCWHRVGNVSGWVGEGLAEHMAERVLGDACPYGQAAELVGRQFARRNVPLDTLLHRTGMIAPHEYNPAHSLVRFLIDRDPAAFTQLIADLKADRDVEAALIRRFGLTFDKLDNEWRRWVVAAS